METYFSDQAVAFLWSVVLGAALGVLYDIFRILRIFRGRNPWVLVFLEDLLFSALAAISTAYVLSRIYYGQVRLFLLLGQGLGFLIYHKSIGRFVGKAARLLARFFRYLGRSLKIFMNFLKKPFIFLNKWCRMKLHHFKRREKRREKKGDRKSQTFP